MEQEPKIENKNRKEAFTLSAEAWMTSEEIWNDAVQDNSTKIDKDVAEQFILKAQEAISAFEKYLSNLNLQTNKEDEINDIKSNIESLKQEITRMKKGVEGIME